MTERFKIFIAAILSGSFLSYSCFLYLSLPAQASQTNEMADRGKLIWQKHNCVSCHQVYGLGGFLGPDLTNVYTHRGENYIKSFVKGGTVVMPSFNLSENELIDLLAYFKELDASGVADPLSFKTHFDGTISQK